MTTQWFSSRAFALAISLMIIGVLVTGVHLFPPLTQGGLARTYPLPVGATAAPADPAAWCRATLSGVDCACFAQKTSEVMDAPHQPVHGLVYADRWQLARTQASAGC